VVVKGEVSDSNAKKGKDVVVLVDGDAKPEDFSFQNLVAVEDAKEDVNQVNKQNQTPLWVASHSNHPDIVGFLLEQPKIEKEKGVVDPKTGKILKAPLQAAVRANSIDVVDQLIAAKVSVDKALESAIKQDNLVLVRKLIQNGKATVTEKMLKNAVPAKKKTKGEEKLEKGDAKLKAANKEKTKKNVKMVEHYIAGNAPITQQMLFNAVSAESELHVALLLGINASKSNSHLEDMLKVVLDVKSAIKALPLKGWGSKRKKGFAEIDGSILETVINSKKPNLVIAAMLLAADRKKTKTVIDQCNPLPPGCVSSGDAYY
jgi:hypothetical protein